MGTAIYKIADIFAEICCNEQGVTSLRIGREGRFRGDSQPSKLSELVKIQLEEYFDGSRKVFTFPTDISGTPFQKRVWQALCEIPYGETRSYKDIAIKAGSPRAYRAVGMANHVNPISIAVP